MGTIEITLNKFDPQGLWHYRRDINELLQQLSGKEAPQLTNDRDVEDIMRSGCFFNVRGPGMRIKDGRPHVGGMATLCPIITPFDTFGWVHAVVVHKKWRGKDRSAVQGKSIAQLLMEEVIGHAATPGLELGRPSAPLKGITFARLDLTCHPRRRRANKLYKKLGFALVSPRDAALYEQTGDAPAMPSGMSIGEGLDFSDVKAIWVMCRESGLGEPDVRHLERAYGPLRAVFFARAECGTSSRSEIVGLGCVNAMRAPDGMSALVSDIVVRAAHTGTGLAGALASYGVGRARKMGAKKVMLRCGATWFADQKLGEAGFTRTETNYYTKILSQPVSLALPVV